MYLVFSITFCFSSLVFGCGTKEKKPVCTSIMGRELLLYAMYLYDALCTDEPNRAREKKTVSLKIQKVSSLSA